MSRVAAIIALVGVAMASGVAGASSTSVVEIPVQLGADPVNDAPESVVVEKGDHLWKISARHLGDDVPETDIAPYWREVIVVNTPLLRSGDPDLIYPGEVVELPERPSREQR